MNLWSKLIAQFSKHRLEREMAEEMSAHLDGLTERNIAKGMSPEEARYAAQREFGGVEQIKEQARDVRGWVWLEQMMQDVRYGVRQLYKSPGFTTVALLTLALGIGASTVIYNVTYCTLLYPFPYKNADRIWCPNVIDVKTRQGFVMLPEDYPKIAALPAVESAMAGTWTMELATGADGMNAELIKVVHLTDTAFSFFGVPPILGRGIGPGDINADGNKAAVTVLTYKAWERIFQKDPNVLGRTLKLGSETYEIIGVAAPRFKFKTDDGFYIPLGPNSHVQWINTRLRLKSGVSPEVAEQQIHALYQGLARDNPLRFGNRDVTVEMPNIIRIGVANGELSSSLYLLLGAVGFLLLIACTNVANLQLARGAARSREIAIRLALGSTRARLIRQLLTESLLLAFSGGILGCMLSYGLIRTIVKMIPPRFVPNEALVTMNTHVLVVAVGISVMTGIIFGLAPAFKAGRTSPNETLKDGTSAASAGQRQRRMGRSLVVLEVTLAVILLFAATLTVRGFVKLVQVDPGFHSASTLQFQVPLPLARYPTPLERNAFARDLHDSVASLPGVADVSIGGIPYNEWVSLFEIPGHKTSEQRRTGMSLVSENYRKMMGIPLLRGDDFEARDIADKRSVVLINEALAQLWPANENPIGSTIRLANLLPRGTDFEKPPSPDSGLVTIIGIVGNTRNFSLLGEIPPCAYVPYTIVGPYATALTVRTEVEPLSLLNPIRAKIRNIDPDLPLIRPTTADDLIDDQVQQPRFNMTLFSGLAVLGLTMACAGIYSVLAYQVAQRTREYGIRMALGAQPSDLLRLVVREGGMLLLIGLLLGGGLSLALARIVNSKVFLVPLLDPWSLVITSVVMCATAFFACWLPARRATRVDPIEALRHE